MKIQEILLNYKHIKAKIDVLKKKVTQKQILLQFQKHFPLRI